MASARKKHKKNNEKPNLPLLIGLLLICLVLFAKLPEITRLINPKKIIIHQPHVVPTEKPMSIEIKNVMPPVHLIAGQITNGQWDLTDSQGLYLSSSAPIGSAGNTVMYGHNTNQVFGKLLNAHLADVIIVTTSEKRMYKYKISKIKTVMPDAIEILNPTSDSRLTIFTCNGFFDSTRLVIIAKKIS